jgi:predicted CXXCH cytochrome family protein
MAGYKRADGSPLPTTQVAEFKQSVHGRALLEKGDLGAPACNDCHGNHSSMPPEVASVAQVCRTCHALNGQLFDGSKHKKAFTQHHWPECDQCHGKHAIAATSDALLSDAPDGLCGRCHAQFAKDHPKCNEGVRYFRASLAELTTRATALAPEIERLAERGLDVEPISAAAGELDEAIVQSRLRIHSFDAGGFDVAALPGRDAIKKTESLIDAARAEQRFRRNGLLAALGVMILLAAVLALKIRQLNRKRDH